MGVWWGKCIWGCGLLGWARDRWQLQSLRAGCLLALRRPADVQLQQGRGRGCGIGSQCPLWAACTAARSLQPHIRSPCSQYETRARLERLSASSAISSADLFEEQRKQTAGTAPTVSHGLACGQQGALSLGFWPPLLDTRVHCELGRVGARGFQDSCPHRGRGITTLNPGIGHSPWSLSLPPAQ